MFCRHCGKELPDDAAFCTACGKPQRTNADTGEKPASTDAQNTSTGYELIRTEIVGSHSKASTASTVGRAAVGGALAGPAGAIVAGMTGRDKSQTTFLQFYSDGSTDSITVETGGILYRRYIKYLNGPPQPKSKAKKETEGCVTAIMLGVIVIIAALVYLFFFVL